MADMADKVVAFIPARGGSKRVPRKNVAPLAGRPLLAWTIEAAQKSGLFSNIVVSSDDTEIQEVARSCGAEADARPASLATDAASTVAVLAEYLERAGGAEQFGAFCLLPPTSPLRVATDIQEAFAMWRQMPDAFVISVTRYEFPPEFAAELGPENELRLRQPDVYRANTQTQSLAAAVHPNGAIYIGSTKRFLQERAIYVPPMRGFPMPPERSLDLDYPHQMIWAEEALLRMHRSTSDLESIRP
jgi:CMP-N-acetylneuraminic acid synthetase